MSRPRRYDGQRCYGLSVVLLNKGKAKVHVPVFVREVGELGNGGLGTLEEETALKEKRRTS